MPKHLRNSYRRRQRKLFLYCLFLLILSGSFAAMYAVYVTNGAKAAIMIAGALFWIGLVGTIIMAVNINNSRKNSASFKSLYPNLKQFGLICFFRNVPATIADITMFVSIITFIILKLFVKSTNAPQFFAIAVFVFSFGMHCMLNGINYIYVKYRSRRR